MNDNNNMNNNKNSEMNKKKFLTRWYTKEQIEEQSVITSAKDINNLLEKVYMVELSNLYQSRYINKMVKSAFEKVNSKNGLAIMKQQDDDEFKKYNLTVDERIVEMEVIFDFWIEELRKVELEEGCVEGITMEQLRKISILEPNTSPERLIKLSKEEAEAKIQKH